MKDSSYMSIGRFAALTGIKRANLIFYDRIGLLSPEHREENKYRGYSQHQLGTAFLISELRELGIGIKEIKGYADSRTPAHMTALFAQQQARVQAEIEKLTRLKGMMRLYTEMAAEAPVEALEEIRVVEKEREPIFLGPPASGLREKEEEDLQAFYSHVEAYGTEYCYPLGAVIGGEDLLRGHWGVSRFYMRLPFGGVDWKPAGRYVTGYMRSDYGKADTLFARLMAYITKNGLTVRGSAYEECPLNEISTKNADDYIIKVEILVGERR